MVVAAAGGDVAEEVDDVWWSKDINTSTSTRAGPISSVPPYTALNSARFMSNESDGNIGTSCALCGGE